MRLGGQHSTRWPQGYQRKVRVEECRTLAIGELLKDGALDPGIQVTWRNQADEVTFVVQVRPESTPDGPALRLDFIVGDHEQIVCQTVELERVAVLGGRSTRWFGRCPICLEQRVGKLYLPPGHRFFGCRTSCYDLGYQSSQTSNGSVRALRQNPERCLALFNSTPTTSLGYTRWMNSMRAMPHGPWEVMSGGRFKGAGRVPWDKWYAAYLMEDREDGGRSRGTGGGGHE